MTGLELLFAAVIVIAAKLMPVSVIIAIASRPIIYVAQETRKKLRRMGWCEDVIVKTNGIGNHYLGISHYLNGFCRNDRNLCIVSVDGNTYRVPKPGNIVAFDVRISDKIYPVRIEIIGQDDIILGYCVMMRQRGPLTRMVDWFSIPPSKRVNI